MKIIKLNTRRPYHEKLQLTFVQSHALKWARARAHAIWVGPGWLSHDLIMGKGGLKAGARNQAPLGSSAKI